MRDQGARDEIRANLGETLFVEAGAGTGKTTMLVQRIVNLVRDARIPMREIAAITFTEAAATELRDRIRAELVAAELPEGVDEVDEAAISTLHAFAQRILAEHPVEAGLPPAIEVLDDIQSELAFDDRWSEFLDVLLSSDDYADELLIGTAAGIRIDSLREIALVFDDHWDRLEDDTVEWARPARPPISAAAVVEPLQKALAAREECIAEEDLLFKHLALMEPVVARLQAATGDLELIHLLQAVPKLTSRGGRKTSWKCDVDALKNLCAQAEAAKQALLDQVRCYALEALLVALRGFALDCAGARKAEGRLAFHDLLVLARDLVRDHRDVRVALRERFARILIDEFQDTDPLQVELAVMLAATDEGDADRSWSDQLIEPGRLFFVGDAMQSIYRFRRADIRLFSQVREFVEHARHLTHNHRSVPGILSYVNTVFGALVGEGRDGAQPRYTELEPARGPLPKAPPPVVLLGGEHTTPIAAVREVEAEEIAETVLRIREEQWQIRDEDAPGTRTARLRDIAILMPTRATLPQLEATLDNAGVPYRVESASLVWGTQNVRDLVSALRAIDDPTDAVSLVATLRSPSFGCGDDDLLEFVQAGGRWDYRGAAPESLSPEHPVVSGMQQLAALHRERWWQTVSGVVDRVARELHLFELALVHPRPRDHWRRLRWVIDQARAFEEGAGGSLRDFVRWADRQADEDARVKESALPESDDDAVRILTVHGSKGLQFPVVIVTGLNRPRNAGGNRPASVLWDGNAPEVTTWGHFKTAGYDALKVREVALDEEERVRLLYVALTRAEDHLIVSVHHKRNDKSQAMELYGLSNQTSEWCRRLGTPPLRLVQEVAEAAPAITPANPAARREWSAAREATIDTLTTAPVRAATAVAALRATEAEPDPDAPPWRRGRAGTSIGRAVHAVLQSVDLTTGAGLAAIARAQAAAEGVEADRNEVERLAAAALASDAVKQAVAARHWRELYVAAPIAGTGVTVEGFIDLLYEDADGLVIVDYKTDSVRSEADVEATLGRYRLQGATYALALEETLHKRVSACVFVFVGGGTARERAIDDLDAAKDEVRTLLAGSPIG